MVAKNLLTDLLSLPVTERIEVFERLRESLLNDPELSPLSEEHKQILSERLAAYEREPDEGVPWEELEQRLLNRLPKQQ